MTNAADIAKAADVLRRGGVVAYPTDTLWGLGARLADDRAVERVFELKRRPRSEPLSIAVSSASEIERFAVVTPAARRLFPLLPGALTLVLEKRGTVPDAVTGGRADVGVRVPAHPECLALIRAAGAITSTSANLHGEPNPSSLDEVRRIFENRVDFYLATTTLPTGAASTVVDARSDPVRVLRSGALLEPRIRELLRQ